MSITIDQKSENGCKVQNHDCGRSRVMLRFRLVKTTEKCNDVHANADNDILLHGTQVLNILVPHGPIVIGYCMLIDISLLLVFARDLK